MSSWSRRAAISTLCGLLAVFLVIRIEGALAGAGDAAAAQRQPTGPTFALGSQSTWVLPGAAFDVTVDASDPAISPGALGLQLRVYDRITTRSGFERSLTSTNSSDELGRTSVVPLTELALAGRPGIYKFSLGVLTEEPDAPPGATGVNDSVDLSCVSECPGVYPVTLQLLDQTNGSVLSHFTTFMTYVDGYSSNQDQLRVAWVIPIHAVGSEAVAGTALHQRHPEQTHSLSAPRVSGRALTDLAMLTSNLTLRVGKVPVSLAVDPRTVQALSESSATNARDVLLELAHLSSSAYVDVPSPSYVPIDVGSLSASDLGSEISEQLDRSTKLLTTAGIASRPGTWIATGAIGDSLGSGLKLAQADQVVIPSNAISSSDSLDVTQPFSLSFGHGDSAQAAVSDDEVTAQFTAHVSDPVLAANQLLADFAFVHFEEPFAGPRGLIALPSATWVPNQAFVTTLLDGLQANPVVVPVTLEDFFAKIPSLGDNDGSQRQLADPGAGSALPTTLTTSIQQARANLNAFATAVPNNPGVVDILNDRLLDAESSELSTAQKQAGVKASGIALDGQLHDVQLATERTITLTSRTASLPLTILSSAPYNIDGVLTVSSDKLEFAGGATSISQRVDLTHSVTSLRLPVTARTSGDLPVYLTFSTPGGGLVIARGRLTVRSTATSLVAIVLTLLAALVLAAWWGRTWMARRRTRSVGPEPEVPGDDTGHDTGHDTGDDASSPTPQAGAEAAGSSLTPGR